MWLGERTRIVFGRCVITQRYLAETKAGWGVRPRLPFLDADNWSDLDALMAWLCFYTPFGLTGDVTFLAELRREYCTHRPKWAGRSDFGIRLVAGEPDFAIVKEAERMIGGEQFFAQCVLVHQPDVHGLCLTFVGAGSSWVDGPVLMQCPREDEVRGTTLAVAAGDPA